MGGQQPAYNLLDLVELQKLQQIQDAFAQANQVASTIVDTDGVPITTPSNYCRVCTIVRGTQKGLANCIRSGKVLGERGARQMQPFHQQCLSVGFHDASAPIIVEGQHIANWLIGQYFVGEGDEATIRQYAREIEADEDEMAAAFVAMPKMSQEHFEKVLQFLWLMANEISRLGYLNLVQSQQRKELEEAKNRLEEHQAALEEKVALRTKELNQTNLILQQELMEKEASQRRQARLIRAIENLAEAIIITDQSASIIYVNPAFTSITGYLSHEAVGRTPSMLKSGLQDADFYQQFWQALINNGSWSGQFINRKKDGSLYTGEATVSAVRDEQGLVVNYVAVQRDITKEREMERQLQQAAKLEAIGTLAAGMAHEINTPVQYLGTNLEFLADAFSDLGELIRNLLAEDGLLAGNRQVAAIVEEADWSYLEEEVPRALSQSQDGVRQISTIVLAMKEFAHPGSKEKAASNLNRLLETTLTVARNEWKYVAEVSTELSPELPPVPCLADQIGQVFLNLIINAAHAVGEKSSKESESSFRGRLTIRSWLEGNEACISIGDNGTGIPADHLDKIYNPFFTTKSVGKGTGQGLAIAYDIVVNKHRGRLSCRSEVGVGTEFVIALPVTGMQEE